MNQKDFFQQLKNELHGHPYRERFLEELENHAEDLKKHELFHHKKLTDEIMEKRMGDPKTVKENFLNIMNPFGKLFFVLEGLFYGGIFLPLAILINAGLRTAFLMGGGIFQPLPLLITSLLGSVSLFVIYRMAFRRFFELSENSFKKRFLWFTLLSLPGLLLFSFMTLGQPSDILANQTANLFLMFDFYLGLHFISAYLGWKYSKKSLKKKIKTGWKTTHYLKIFVLSYFFVSVIARTIFINNASFTGEMTNPILATLAPLIGIFSLIIPIEFISVFWWSAMLDSGYDEVNIFTTFYLPICLIIFLGLQSLYVVIQQRKWFSFRGLIIFYALSLFFIRSDSFINMPEFKVPAINISSLIEKERLGIFYPIMKYFNSDEGSLFKYQVGLDVKNNEGFIIQGNAGKFYPLSLNGLEEKFNDPSFDSLIGGVSDVYINEEHKAVSDYTASDETFWDQFISNRTIGISDSILSPDGKWGLIAIPNGVYDPEEVYLVKLKN